MTLSAGVGRQSVMHQGQHVVPLAAGGGSAGLLGLSSPQRRLSRLAGVCHQAGTWRFTGLVPEDRGELCQQVEVLPVLPCRLSISSKLTSNYMVNGINVKSSSLSSLRLNASLRQRHLIALWARSCLFFKPE